VKSRFIERVKTENEVALEVARIVEMSSGSNDQMELQSHHVAEVCLIHN
jgi:hypothetical protein